MRTTLSQKERKVVESENSAIDPILDVRLYEVSTSIFF